MATNLEIELPVPAPTNQFQTLDISLPVAPYNWDREFVKDARVDTPVLIDVYRPTDEGLSFTIDGAISSDKLSRPRISLGDNWFALNTQLVADALPAIEGSDYFIADCGMAHLFAVAKALRQQGVDVGFYLPEQLVQKREPVSRFDIRTALDAMQYYADHYAAAKAKDITNSRATMIDLHRGDQIPQEAFLTVEQMRALGIQRVVVLGEDVACAQGTIRESEGDLVSALDMYRQQGLDVFVQRVDSRGSMHDPGFLSLRRIDDELFGD